MRTNDYFFICICTCFILHSHMLFSHVQYSTVQHIVKELLIILLVKHIQCVYMYLIDFPVRIMHR